MVELLYKKTQMRLKQQITFVIYVAGSNWRAKIPSSTASQLEYTSFQKYVVHRLRFGFSSTLSEFQQHLSLATGRVSQVVKLHPSSVRALDNLWTSLDHEMPTFSVCSDFVMSIPVDFFPFFTAENEMA